MGFYPDSRPESNFPLNMGFNRLGFETLVPRGQIVMIPSMHASRPTIATIVVWACLSGVWPNVLAQVQTRSAGPQIPFIGCESGGQVGPLKAPNDKGEKLAVPAEVANRVAYYQAENGFGVLAPRGWHCYSIYGSSGSSLYVTPEPIDRNLKGVSGQAIQVRISYGDTSGRFEVAKIIARVFPAHIGFVHNVENEGIMEPAPSFRTGPYPTDKMTYRSKEIVEFETPPNAKGLGTDSMLRANSSAIRGVAILFGDETNLAQASIRLSPRDQDLIQPIMKQIEKEAADSNNQ
jgi:hypothetical protein